MAATQAPPVMEARRWTDGVAHPPDRPLINVSQAAPTAPPTDGLIAAMVDAMRADASAHLYGPVLGRPDLREALAATWSRAYGAEVGPERVAITSGCNQGFAAAIAVLAEAGDEVILPVPWYFNHAMWLTMSGVRPVALPVGGGMLPEPGQAASLIGPRTRAIALVTPNNPAGVEYPADLIAAFHDLARERGVALILDETYHDFRDGDGPAHDCLARDGHDATLIQLYSFSKAYRLTGHRVGAMVAAPAFLAQVEKFLDTVTICPAQPGQIGALWGLRNLSGWLADEAAEIARRRAALRRAAGRLPGWRLLGLGGYFAYLTHPFDMPSDRLARHLVTEAGILMLPGTMFRPEGDADGAREVRVAFANVDTAGITVLADRLAALGPLDDARPLP